MSAQHGIKLAHMSAQLGIIFLDKTQNGTKTGFKPVTTWPSKAFTTRLLLQLCCCASYYFFVLCLGVLIQSSQRENGSETWHLSGLVGMVVKFKLKFKFKFLQNYSKFYLNLNSSSSLNSNFSEFNANLNLGQGP
jgi:hypothetical protein